MFALSLSWNVKKFKSATKQIKEVTETGFKAIELNFGLTEKQIDQIDALRKKGEIKVVSCHNYCPIPRGLSIKKALPDYYSLASLKEKRRHLALKYTKRSIDTVARLKAKALVIHSGRVEMYDESKVLMQLFARGEAGSSGFKSIANRLHKEREEKKGPYLEAAFESIKELAAYAKKKNIKLTLENRIYYPEIPHLEEVAFFLDKSQAFFWFDTGHAYIMEKLWSIKSEEYLKRFSSKLVGIHIHDIKGMQDHLAPGCGEYDFSILRDYIKPSTVKVIEAHAPATSEELKRSVIILNKAFK